MNYQESCDWAAALATRTTADEYRSQGGCAVMAYDLARWAAIDRGLISAPPTPTREEVLAAWTKYVRLTCEWADSLTKLLRKNRKNHA